MKFTANYWTVLEPYVACLQDLDFLFGDSSLSLGCIPILFEFIFLNLGS
jgi:hypothetical protein